MKRFHQFHAEQDAILAKMLPEAELDRILSRENARDEVAEWSKRVDAAKRAVERENLE
jgi:hypothetical protein